MISVETLLPIKGFPIRFVGYFLAFDSGTVSV
jgi:hypothetical protein